MQAKLNCPPVPPGVDRVPGLLQSDYPAHSGYATPTEILARIRASRPDADPSFEMTGANKNTARFENGRTILLAHRLDDGQWYITERYITERNSCWNSGG